MERRRFIGLAGRAILGGSAVFSAGRRALGSETGRGRRRPNLVVILADDLGYGDVGCYGNRRIRTPNLDALAAGGVRFTDFHSSGAVCSPTRAGLVTGRYQQRCGIPAVLTAAHHRDKGLPLGEITFAEQLKRVGYTTAIFGKWHLGYAPRFNPVNQGFDRFRGYVSGNVDYFSHVDQTGVADWWDGPERSPEEGYVTHLITEHSVRFIEENRDRPFCLYVAHEAPHYPYQGPHDKAVRIAGKKGWPIRGARKDVAAAYKEMIEALDEGIGRIVETLKRLGLERDTFIFFFSDNGATGPGSNGPLRGKKATLWEGGHRVPAIAYWPGKIAAGRLCAEPTISFDLFPTLLELGRAPMPKDRKIDGASLAPLLLEGKSLGERTLFWAHGKSRAVRRGDWKLLLAGRGRQRKPRLFNLAEDLGEKRDLADAEPDRVRSMTRALAEWEKDVMSERGRASPRTF